MRRRAKSIIISLLIGASIGCALCWHSARGRAYQGRRTAVWVKRALHGRGRSEAFEAVLKIGAPAVPIIARQGLHDKCHTFRFLSSRRALNFAMNHPRLGRWLRIDRWMGSDVCVVRHERAAWLLGCMGTNAQAAIPDVIDCLEHCPEQHFADALELLDTLGEISGTNPAAIPYLTRRARGNDSLCLRAAAVAYFINGQTNLFVETCQRLARKAPSQLLCGHELFWFRDNHSLNQHLVPLLEELYADPRSNSRDRETVMFELRSRGNDAAAAMARLLAAQTNAAVHAIRSQR